MDLETRILQSLRPRKDGVLLRSDIGGFGSPSQVSAVLKRLCDRGLLVRIDRGVFAKPSKVKELGRSALLAAAKARGSSNANSKLVRLRRAKGTSVARYVEALAKRHGVRFVPLYADRWAGAVTRLAGDEVKSDATDDLLVALRRKKVISAARMVKLVMEHHRSQPHV